MDFITGWIFNIIIFLLLTMIVDMLLPDSDMKKYTKLITGLLLIAIIVTPIFKIFSVDLEKMLNSITANIDIDTQTTENLLERKKREIQASHHAYTLEQMAVQMKKQVDKELMNQHQVVIENIKISASTSLEPPYSLDELNKITVYISPANSNQVRIEPVSIKIKDDIPQETQEDFSKIISLLAVKWEVSEEIIEIVSGEDRR